MVIDFEAYYHPSGLSQLVVATNKSVSGDHD
ncbi:hypothetical protein ES702_07869 [subsurface metagenome]